MSQPPDSSARRLLGLRGEALAADHLRRRGYLILARNVRCPGGEIDIVAQHAGGLAFVEVRTRTAVTFARPEETVRGTKRQRMLAAARWYLDQHGLDSVDWSLDLVAIEIGPGGRVRRITHHVALETDE